MNVYDKKQYMIKTFDYLDERKLLKDVNPACIYCFFEKLRRSENKTYNANDFFEIYKSSVKNIEINEKELFASFLSAIQFFAGHVDVIDINHINYTDIKEWIFLNKIGN